jgi:hypothetical protein
MFKHKHYFILFIYLQSKCIQLHLKFITFQFCFTIEEGVIPGLKATYNL